MNHGALPRALIIATAILLGCISGATVGAQTLPESANYRIRAFGVADGLPNSEIVGFAQTPDHFLWIGTARGLVRYDGHEFEVVPTPGIDQLVWIHLDRRHRIWLNTWTNRMALVEDGKLRLLPEIPGYETSDQQVRGHDRIMSFSESTDGSIWLGGGSGLVRTRSDQPGSWTRYTMADGLPSDSVHGVFDLPGGERVAVTGKGVAKLLAGDSPADIRFQAIGPACTIGGDVRVSRSGVHLTCLEANRRYHRLDYVEGSFERRDFPAGHWASGIDATPPLPDSTLAREPLDHVADNLPYFAGHHLHIGLTRRALGLPPAERRLAGHLLRAGDGSVWRSLRENGEEPDLLLHERDGRIERVPLRNHLEFARIHLLFEDHEGSLWVGTDRGILQVIQPGVTSLTTRDGLGDGFVLPVLRTKDNALWVGSWGGGLHRFANGGLERHYTTADGLPSPHVRALYESSDGTLWIGTRYGTATLRDGRFASHGNPRTEVRAFADGPDGSFWIATAHALLRLPSAAVEPTPRHVVVTGSFWTLHIARDGSIWAGSEEGLFTFSDGAIRRVDGHADLTDNFFVSIREEADGTLWFGTLSEGLVRYKGGRMTTLTTDDGLASNGIWCILDDGDGGVWLSSDQGVSRAGYTELHAAADARERGEQVEGLQPLHFTEDQGLPSREFNRASPPCQQLDDGRLVFNNLAGVVVIDPRHAAEVPAPRAVLRTVIADGAGLSIDTRDPVRLDAGTRHLQFDFRALSFAAPERNRYRYRLQGYDQEWLDAGFVSRASYTSLPPGRYVFEVQAIAGGTGWGEAASWPFFLPPHFWQTVWFRGLVATMLIATAVVAYRFRVARLLEMERLRLRIASDLHDDLGANMSTIALLSESLRDRERPDGRERRQLERIGTAAADAMVALRDAIWLVDPKHDTVTALVQRLRTVAVDLLPDQALHFDVRGRLPSRRLDATVVRSVFLAYKEALTNVARHSRATRVDITVETEGGHLHVTVADDGIGFDPSCPGPADDRRSGGQGHANMRRRALEVGGRIEIDSAPGRGTRLRFSVTL